MPSLKFKVGKVPEGFVFRRYASGKWDDLIEALEKLVECPDRLSKGASIVIDAADLSTMGYSAERFPAFKNAVKAGVHGYAKKKGGSNIRIDVGMKDDKIFIIPHAKK